MLGKKNLTNWMAKMSQTDVPMDELAIFALSKFYDRHTLIYMNVRPWTTFSLEHATTVKEAYQRCQMHLVYLGQNKYGGLKRRPFINIDAPLSVDEVLNLMHLCQTTDQLQQ